MKITQTTQPWGNSIGTRLPQKVLQAAKWHDRQEFAIDIKGRSIILTPVDKPSAPQRVRLADMLRDVTPADIRGEFDWGADRGKEIIDD